MRPPLPAVAAEQCGVVTTGQAATGGWSVSMLQTAVAHGALDRLWHGVYALPAPPGPEGAQHRIVQRAVGAALSHSDLAVTHLAAAGVDGFAFWAPRPRGCVTSAETSLSSATGVHVHRCPVPADELVRSGSVARTTPARTVVDIAREFGVEAALVTADAAIRTGRLTTTDLAGALARAAGRPGIRRARAVLELVDGRAESPLESRSRYRIAAAGLPAPVPQAVILDEHGRFVARVDFLWPEWGVVGEADGRAKYARDMTRRTAEGRRRAALEDLGLIYEFWGWDELEPFAPTAARLTAALSRASLRPAGRRAWRLG